MKKFLILIIILFSVTGCFKEKDLDIYLDVVDCDKPYINEENKEVNINDYLKELNYTNNIKVRYAIVDLDNDSKDEMVVGFSSDIDENYLVLNIEDDKVYGFTESYRGMLDLKTDGTMTGNNGADNSQIYRMSFDKNKRTDTVLASMNEDKYQIDNKDVTSDEYNDFVEKQAKKENVKFKDYKTIEEYQNVEK